MSSHRPQAQIEFLDYEPKGAALALLDCEVPEVLVEGPAGTGKTRAVLEKLNYLCETHPGIRCLICRSTRTSLTESVMVTMESKVLWPGHPAMSGDANRSNRHSYDYPNGSTIVCGSLDRPERLYSTEWDLVYVAEATEITEDAWEKFARAMRNNVLPYQQRIADCNPDAPGHWLNRRASTGKMLRLLSRHEDNPSISDEYLIALRGLTGHRRARLYEGRWVAAEGSVFANDFSIERHVVRRFDIPHDWPGELSCDPGYAHVLAMPVAAIAPNGRLYFVAERVKAQSTIKEHSDWITAYERGCGFIIRHKYGDPHDMFKHTLDGNGRSKAEQFGDYGHRFIPAPAANNAAELSAQVEMIRTGLATMLADGMPAIQFMDSCPMLISAMQSHAYKRTVKGELAGAEDQFDEAYKDEMDGIRMIVASRPAFTPSTIKVY